MSFASFHARATGKWVLAGEHAVLRGATAIALPHPSVSLELTFQPQVWDGLSVAPRSSETVVLELVQALRDEWQQQGRSFPEPRGMLQLESTIPQGAGLGSSAALCVALARWLAEPLGLSPVQAIELASRLEHRFHGRSSGMDVAVIAAGEPVSYVAGKGSRALGVRRLPAFTFHDTGLRARTSDCVLRVERLREDRPAVAMRIDERMGAASRSALEGLVRFDRGDDEVGLLALAEGMRLAQECFRDWELVPGDAARMEAELRERGALGVKLTGAGGGGMLVALWR